MNYRHREAPAHQANHPVPVKPVLAVVERWIAENAAESGWTTNGRSGVLRPERQLAQVMGLKWSTVARQLYRPRARRGAGRIWAPVSRCPNGGQLVDAARGTGQRGVGDSALGVDTGESHVP